MEPKYKEVEVQLTGEDGNAFAIMGRVTKALRTHLKEQGWEPAEIKAEVSRYQNQAMSGSYEELLQATMDWVTVL